MIGVTMITSSLCPRWKLFDLNSAPSTGTLPSPGSLPAFCDELFSISDDRAIETSRRLAAEEGLFVGISAGATMATALEVAQNAPEGSVILAMLPDTGERYFSTPLFADINEGSDDDWLAGLP